MSGSEMRRTSITYDSQGRVNGQWTRVVGPPGAPVEQFTYDCEEEPAGDTLPFRSLEIPFTHVTLSREDGRLLAVCRPVGDEMPPSRDASPDCLPCRSGRLHFIERKEAGAWPASVVVRFFDGGNLLDMLIVSNTFQTAQDAD